MDLRDEIGMAIMMITHSMGIIAETADRVVCDGQEITARVQGASGLGAGDASVAA